MAFRTIQRTVMIPTSTVNKLVSQEWSLSAMIPINNITFIIVLILVMLSLSMPSNINVYKLCVYKLLNI